MNDAEKLLSYAADLARSHNLDEASFGIYTVEILADALKIIATGSYDRPDRDDVPTDSLSNVVPLRRAS